MLSQLPSQTLTCLFQPRRDNVTGKPQDKHVITGRVIPIPAPNAKRVLQELDTIGLSR